MLFSQDAKVNAEHIQKYYNENTTEEFEYEMKEKDLSYLIEQARQSLDEILNLKNNRDLNAQYDCLEAIECLGDVLAVMQWIIDEEYKEK